MVTLVDVYNQLMLAQRNYETSTLRRATNNLEVWQRLKDAGLTVLELNLFVARYGGHVEVKISDLPTLRQFFPKVEDTKNYRLHDAETETVKVILNVGFEPNSFMIYYLKKLDAYSKCRIVRQQETVADLVCSFGD